MNGGAKENANPAIHRVDDKCLDVPIPISLQKWKFGGCNDDDESDQADFRETNTTPEKTMIDWYSTEDIAIVRALCQVSESTKGIGVSLLTQGGLELKEPPSRPMFIPSDGPWQQQQQQQQQQSPTVREPWTNDEIFELIRNIQDPEHPLTLEQLNVVKRKHVQVYDHYGSDPPKVSTIDVQFTPTIPHCSMATLIGLSLRVKLFRSVPPRFRVTVRIEPGTHASEHAINQQLADKERVSAALENKHLLGVVNKCIAHGL